MAFFICIKNQENTEGAVAKIVSSQNNLNYLNPDQNLYKIIEDNSVSMQDLNLNKIIPIKFTENSIVYKNVVCAYRREAFKNQIIYLRQLIEESISKNENFGDLDLWKNYKASLGNLLLNDNQINNLIPIDPNTQTEIKYTKSVEEYISSIGGNPLNILLLP